MLSCLAFLAGCAAGPEYHKPADLPGDAVMPDHFKESPVAMQAAALHDGAEQPDPSWWLMFGDPVLNGLMKQLESANQNLATQEAVYRQAISNQKEAQAALWPTVTGNADAARGRTSSANAASLRPTGSAAVGVAATWELDLWGRLRRSLESSSASTQASAGDLAAARLSLQAQLATSYASLSMADQQKELLASTVQAYADILQRQQNRYRQGVISQLDVVEAASQLQSAQAQLTNADIQRAALEHAIATLIGKPPATFSLPPQKRFPLAFPDVPALLPSTLLERRPDVAAAERRMAAANANIGVAEAAFFPNLTFSASGGYSGSSLNDVFTAPNQVWSLGSALAVTLFDHGARKALTEQAQAVYDQQVAAYRQVVLSALQDAEDSLAALRILKKQESEQEQVVASTQHTVDLTLQQYEAGKVGYLNVLVAQATLLSAKQGLLTVREQRCLAVIALLKSTGGGWSSPKG